MDQLLLPLFSSSHPAESGTPPLPRLAPTFSLANAVQAYLAFLKTGAFSPNTVRNFACDIAMMQRFLGPERQIGTTTSHHIRNWVGELNRPERGLSAKSISRHVATTRHFFAWLYNEGSIADNPAAEIPCRRVTSPLPLILNDTECQQLRELASQNTRTHLIVELLLSTGIKKGELTALRLAHLDIADSSHPFMHIVKSDIRRNRTLRLPIEIVPLMDLYREQYKIDDRLFNCTDRNIEYILKDLSSRLSTDKRVGAQILRDTFAAQQLRQGTPIEEVLRMLGLAPMEWNGDIRDKYLKLAGLLG